MKYKINGTTMQALDVELDSGEAVFTETGGMSWMSENIEMDTNMKGGVLSGLKRKLAGESLFMTTYKAKGPSKITFTGEFVGKIIDMNLGAGQQVICQKDAFMCAQDSVSLAIHFQKKLGAGLFGGEGFVLEKVTGPGTVFLEISGEVVERELAAGEKLKVNPGYVAAFEPTVTYDIERVKGVTNMLFGGEGMFLVSLKGPGKVWLQTMPLQTVASALVQYLPIPKSTR